MPLFKTKVQFAQGGIYPRASLATTNGNVNSTKVAPIAKQTIGNFFVWFWCLPFSCKKLCGISSRNK